MRNSPHTLTSSELGHLLSGRSQHGPAVHPAGQGRRLRLRAYIHMNDIGPSVRAIAAPPTSRRRDEFDQLREGATKRRMMVMALHDHISGHANRVRVSIASSPTRRASRASGSPARPRSPTGDEDPRQDSCLDRGPVQKTGLSGPSA